MRGAGPWAATLAVRLGCMSCSWGCWAGTPGVCGRSGASALTGRCWQHYFKTANRSVQLSAHAGQALHGVARGGGCAGSRHAGDMPPGLLADWGGRHCERCWRGTAAAAGPALDAGRVLLRNGVLLAGRLAPLLGTAGWLCTVAFFALHFMLSVLCSTSFALHCSLLRCVVQLATAALCCPVHATLSLLHICTLATALHALQTIVPAQ